MKYPDNRFYISDQNKKMKKTGMMRVLTQCLPFPHAPHLQLRIDPGSPAYMAVAQHQHPHIVIEQKYCKERLEMVSLGLPCHLGRTMVLYCS